MMHNYDLMKPEGVRALMESSKSDEEWDANCDSVKAANNGYPEFWYDEIVRSGLMGRIIASSHFRRWRA
jgi:hypothetical protein